MKIELQSLSLVNFKGIKELTVNFNGITNIKGANNTGKTTVFDAFTWLLFGKNAEDQKEFNIKTIASDGNVMHKLDHEVTGVLIIDGKETTLKRVFKEKWVKTRGEETSEFTGHETLYFINNVPLKQADYNTKISEIVPDEMFKLITNPLYFNSLAWNKRREILFSLVTEKTDAEIITSKPQYARLIELLSNKTLEDLKKEYAFERKKLKEQLDQIPSRVDEASRNMPEEPDYDNVNTEIAKLNEELAAIETKLQDSSMAYQAANEKNQAIENAIFKLKSGIDDAKRDWERSKNNLISDSVNKKADNERRLQTVTHQIENTKTLLTNNQQSLDELNFKITSLRKTWTDVSARELPIFESTCPTCKQPWEGNKAELVKNFTEEKASELEKINKNGLHLKSLLESETKRTGELNMQLSELLAEQGTIQKDLKSIVIPTTDMPAESIQKIESLEREIAEMYATIKPVDRPDNLELLTQRNGTNQEIDGLKALLAVKSVIENTKKRIDQLLKDEKDFAQQMADIENIQFLIQMFEKDKVNAIEDEINSLFQHVTFRMFNSLINGGTEPCCDTLYNGVPFSDVNTGGKLWAGIDIINTLSKYYGIYAPIFIDNRESITLIPETQTQIINLIVDPSCTKLIVQ